MTSAQPRIAGLAALLIAILAWVHPACAEKRIALVIGNSSYRSIAPLPNAGNDAKLMGETLSALGFDLVGGSAQLNLDKAGIDQAVQRFGQAATGANVALFYYAGHGLQVRGTNYLAPVDANPTREADIDFQMVDLNLVLRQVESAGTKLNLVILDACRNNPFAGAGVRTASRGLAIMRAPEGTLISFATQPGNVAADGTDGNSPYTKALATTIRRPGLGIFEAFNEVGLAVKRATGGEQLPWVSNSPIDGSFFFTAPPAPVAGTSDPAAQAWAAVRETTSIAVLDTFLQQYGDSLFAAFARARREELRQRQASLPPPDLAARPSGPGGPPGTDGARPAGSTGQTRAAMPRAEIMRLMAPFGRVLDLVRDRYVEPSDRAALIRAAQAALARAFPPSSRVASTGGGAPRPTGGNPDDVYATAAEILGVPHQQGDAVRVLETATSGMLASLDPHSGYISPEASRELKTQHSGAFGGIGLDITLDNGLHRVVAPIEGAPAARAGVLTNDIFLEVEGEPVQGLSLSRLVERLRGPVGTRVTFKVVRTGRDDPIEFALTRDTIRIRSVRSAREGDVGYLRITQFNAQVYDLLRDQIDSLTREIGPARLRGFVIDLRSNPGGLLEQAVKVSDAFLDRGQIVSTRGRKPSENSRFDAKPGDLTKGKPLIVLINGGSASAAEIVAGSLQDNKRAHVVGTRSFGKGSVQTILPLGENTGALRLTTARYFTPSGRSIQAQGIEPDQEILQDEPEEIRRKGVTQSEAGLPGRLKGGEPFAGSSSYIPQDRAKDTQLTRAIAILGAK